MIPVFLGRSCSSIEGGSSTPCGTWTMAKISVPPDSSLTHEVSGRRARDWARARVAAGLVVRRTTHWLRPTRRGSGSPTTRREAFARSRW
ncbi:hypothetical protein [Nonomuraea angiospora]